MLAVSIFIPCLNVFYPIKAEVTILAISDLSFTNGFDLFMSKILFLGQGKSY